MTTITMMLTLCRRAITLKLLISQKQQSRRRAPTPDGFAFVPHSAVFLDSIRWARRRLAARKFRQFRNIRRNPPRFIPKFTIYLLCRHVSKSSHNLAPTSVQLSLSVANGVQ
jgi:hypothetical protein